MRKILIILLYAGTGAGCYSDVEEQLYGSGDMNCNTNGVGYSTTIAPLLQSNGCIGCHSGGAPSGGIALQTYNSVRLVAQNGKLYGVISQTAGYSPMPKGGNKVSACNINKIKAWIDAGFPNN